MVDLRLLRELAGVMGCLLIELGAERLLEGAKCHECDGPLFSILADARDEFAHCWRFFTDDWLQTLTRLLKHDASCPACDYALYGADGCLRAQE